VEVQSDRPRAGSVAEGGGNASLGAVGRWDAVAVGWRVLLIGGAGQGAHREVGSEGFEAKHRAVADSWRTGRPDPDDAEPALWGRRKYLGRLDTTRCVRAARWESSLCYPGRSRTVLLDGVGSWAYKPRGEVASDAVREVGVVHGTEEPRNNRNLGIAVWVRRRAVTQKAPTWGRGHGGNGEPDAMLSE
jgi:hypothetical protein